MSTELDPIARATLWLQRQIVTDGSEPMLDEGDCRFCGAESGEKHEPTDPCGIVADLLDALRAQRTEGRPITDLIEALEFAWGAIIDAIGLEEGLDGKAGEAVLGLIEAALKAHGRPVSRPQGDGDLAWFTRYLEERLAALKPIERTEGRPPDRSQVLAKGAHNTVDEERQHLIGIGLLVAKRDAGEFGTYAARVAQFLERPEVADLQSQIETLTAERDEARRDVVRMAQSRIGEKCDHHKLSLPELERIALRECPMCWKAACEGAEQQATSLRAALAAITALDLGRDAQGRGDFYTGPDRFFKAHAIAFAALEGRQLTAEGRSDTLNPKLLAIAGLVNGFHNDGATLTADETLRAIADVLGKAMEGADQ